MTPEQETKLLADVKSVTDRMTMVDKVFKAARLGVNLRPVFQCGASGLYYPGDYVRNWGKPYGIGLGPHPVSESLQSEYDVDPPAITPQIRSLDQIMHPLRASCAQMDLLLIDIDDKADGFAVVAVEDLDCVRRAAIIIIKQRANPLSRLSKGDVSVAEAAWKKQRLGGY